jgi:glycosyltransferase involved in cell wall biosynthesis
MKVTMVLGNDFLYPYLDDRVYREAETLKREGWDVCVVCWARTITNKTLDNLTPIAEYKGINVFRIYQNISPVRSLLIKRIAQHLRGMRKMAKKIEETKPDVIHYNDFNTLFSVMFGGKKRRAKALYDSHEDYSLMIKSAVPQYLAKMASRLERRAVKKHVDAFITVSQPIFDRLSKLGVDNKALVMNCKDLRDYDIPEEKIASARKAFIQSLRDRGPQNMDERKPDGIEDMDDKFILLYIGSLGEHRGLRELLNAYKSLDTKNMILLIGGHGSIQDDIKIEMEDMDNALFLGEVKNEVLPLYTTACDAVVMMMNPEEKWHKIAMPNKLFEAMAACVPIIASAGTLYGEVVKKEECGIVIPYGEIEMLKKTIMELAANPDLRTKLGKNGLNAAKREYNWEKQGKKLIMVYNRLIGNGETGPRA